MPTRRNVSRGLVLILLSILGTIRESLAQSIDPSDCDTPMIVAPPTDDDGNLRPLREAEIEYLVHLQEKLARELGGVDATEAANAMSVLAQACVQVGAQDIGMQAARRVKRLQAIGADILALAEKGAIGQKYLPRAAASDLDPARVKAQEVALLLLPLPFAEGGDNRVWLTAGRGARILQWQEDGTFVAHGQELFIEDWSRERWELTGRLYLQRVMEGEGAEGAARRTLPAGGAEAAEMGEDEFIVQIVIIICNDPCNPGPCCFMNCDDGRPCTIDSCQWGECYYTDRECEDDGQFCNGVELPCNPASGCESSGNPCAPLQCKESTDECVECTADGHCDDGDECTDNRCINEECVFPPRNCNDWSFCNGVESCNPSTGCVPGTPPCAAGMICDEIFDRCVECLQDAHCNDGDPCTLDNCVNTVCSNPERFCGDGSFCNGEEWCDSSGDCRPGSPPCPPGLCDEGDDMCVACTTNAQCDDGNACTYDRCNQSSGQCENDDRSCEDGDLCTSDTCDPATGACSHEPRCVSEDSCGEVTCNPQTGGCVFDYYVCDDNNVCTIDICNGGVCEHQPIDCAAFVCCHGYFPGPCLEVDTQCRLGIGCNPESGCFWNSACNDGDPCTRDVCQLDYADDCGEDVTCENPPLDANSIDPHMRGPGFVFDQDSIWPGGFLGVNDDDDNGNGVIDKLDAGRVAGEDDLMPIYLSISGAGWATGTLRLSCVTGCERLRLFKRADRRYPMNLPYSWSIQNWGWFETTVYAEGLEGSEELRDVELRLTFDSGCIDYSESLKLTVLQAQVVDAQAFSPNINGGIDDDPASQVASTWERTGVFADGTSVLVIRLDPQPDTVLDEVSFHVRHANPSAFFPQTSAMVGSVWSSFPALPAANSGGGSILVELNDEAPKIVYYRPPNNFHFGMNLLEQPLQIQAISGGRPIATTRINLVRPTVVLNHGFTSNPGNMNEMRNLLESEDRGVSVRLLDWSHVNTSGYDSVPLEVEYIIQDELQAQRSAGVAATRLDFFGHSMGGVIVKWYAADLGHVTVPRDLPADYDFPAMNWPGHNFAYRRNNNFGVGDIRRLVTVGSPLRGSPVASQLSYRLRYLGVQSFLNNAHLFGMTVAGDGTALNDLGHDSRGTTILQDCQPNLSWFPIVGIGAPIRTESDYITNPIYWAYLDGLEALPSQQGLLPDNSDFMVWDHSQVDRQLGEFPPISMRHVIVENHTHADEARTNAVFVELRRALDLEFTSPAAPDYVGGYTLFNTGF